MPDVFSHSAVAHVSTTVAWKALQLPEVWEDVAGVEHVTNSRHDESGLLLGYRFTVRAGFSSFRGTAETVEAVAPSLFRLRIDSSEMAGSITAQLDPFERDQTCVTVTVEMRAKGLLAQMFYPVVAQAVRTGLPSQVQSFAVKLGTS